MAPRTIFTKLASEEDAPVLASISMRFTVYPLCYSQSFRILFTPETYFKKPSKLLRKSLGLHLLYADYVFLKWGAPSQPQTLHTPSSGVPPQKEPTTWYASKVYFPLCKKKIARPSSQSILQTKKSSGSRPGICQSKKCIS